MSARERKYVKRSSKSYSEPFKLQIVREYESGYGSLAELSRKYGIQGSDTLSRWLQKYGTVDSKYKQTRMKKKSPEQELMALRQEVELLKKQKKVLEQEANLSNKKAAFFDLMVDIAEEELSIEIRKKYSTQASKRTGHNQKKV
jgi:transposase-like protein